MPFLSFLASATMITTARVVCSRISRTDVLRSSVRHAHSIVDSQANPSKQVSAEDLFAPDSSAGARSVLKQHVFTKKEKKPFRQNRANAGSHKGEGQIATWIKEDGKKSGFKPMNSRGKSRYTTPLARQSAVRPAVQSARVKDLAEQGKHEEAIKLVYTAPRHTVDTPTWNTLLSVLMAAGKRKEAYRVYIEVRSRQLLQRSAITDKIFFFR